MVAVRNEHVIATDVDLEALKQGISETRERLLGRFWAVVEQVPPKKLEAFRGHRNYKRFIGQLPVRWTNETFGRNQEVNEWADQELTVLEGADNARAGSMADMVRHERAGVRESYRALCPDIPASVIIAWAADPRWQLLWHRGKLPKGEEELLAHYQALQWMAGLLSEIEASRTRSASAQTAAVSGDRADPAKARHEAAVAEVVQLLEALVGLVGQEAFDMEVRPQMAAVVGSRFLERMRDNPGGLGNTDLEKARYLLKLFILIVRQQHNEAERALSRHQPRSRRSRN